VSVSIDDEPHAALHHHTRLSTFCRAGPKGGVTAAIGLSSTNCTAPPPPPPPPTSSKHHFQTHQR